MEQQNFQVAEIQSNFSEVLAPFDKRCNSSTSALEESHTNSSMGFECNICLDIVQDPVVTFCGHLYCWPCIYRWINFHHAPSEEQPPFCPVCKAEVSQETLIPLYGRGETLSKNKSSSLGLIIPQRPPSPRCESDTLIPNIHRETFVQPSQPYHMGNYTAPPMLGFGGSRMHMADPMIGMLGEMVSSGIFGNSQTSLYAYPNSYNIAGSNSPRLRRHLRQTSKSLSRLYFFLCCCVMLCLLLF